MNVIVFQCPIGTWPTKRSPREFQPFGRTILVLTGFVDKYEAGGVKQPLLAHPASPRPNHVVSLALHGYEAFF